MRAEGLERVFDPEGIDPDMIIEQAQPPAVIDPNLPAVSEPTSSHRIDDSRFIRTELTRLVEITKEALETAAMIQQEDPNCKNTEAVAKMAETVGKQLENLMKLSKIEKDNEYHEAKLKTPAEVS